MQGRAFIHHIMIVAVLFAGLLHTQANAGRIDPGLEAMMQAASGEEFIQVVIRPVGTLVGAELKKQVAARFTTRAEQHTAAVEALQATSAATQPPILNALGSADFDGRVLNAKGFWIDNVITAYMTPSAIAELSQRADIDEILAMPKIELVAPVPADATDVDDAQTSQNQTKAIFADSAWAQGYTGSGRLIASLDTGVEGAHVMLAPKWRGNNGYSSKESWFDPVYGDAAPRVYPGAGATHGTQVMGLMVAVTPGIFDTLGVCPDCQWISAAAIDIPCPTSLAPCGNLFEALQWVADPDGDPLTTDDVPDAVANPWGAVTKSPGDACAPTGVGCSDIFWNAIDNIEAAGAVMIFAAGNEGQCGASTIRNPANRISSELNAFSVGMVDARTSIINPTVDPLSSTGPSDCNNATVKPELVAPGVNLRTTTPPSSLATNAYGTSFSTPLVAGAVALLREYNPNATADQIKQALLTGARDLGANGADNQYGHGILNIAAALRALQANTRPNITVRRNYYTRPNPGQSAQVVLNLKNSGTPATSVAVTITSNDPRLTIQDGTAAFPDMPNVGDTASNHDDPFDVTVSLEDVVSGERIPITVAITASGGYSKTWQAAIQTGPVQSPEIFTHDAGNFQMTVSSFGGFGLQIDNLNPRKGQSGYGVGYLYGNDITPSLFEGAFMVGVSPIQLSDAARNSSGSPDVDFLVDPGGRLNIMQPGTKYPEETRAGMSDQQAENPIGVFVEQRTWVSNDPDEDDYLIAEYTIWNRSGQTINGLRAGLYFDWDFPWVGTQQVPVASRDLGGFDSQLGVGWMYDSEQPRYRGLCVVSPLGTTSYRFLDNLTEVYDGLTEAEKWAGMSQGFVQTTHPSTGDGSHIIGTGPFTIQADSAIRVAFAIIGATSVQDMLNSAQSAKNGYNAGTVTIAPISMQFSAPVGGPDPAAQSITITNNTDVSVTFGVTEVPVFGVLNPSVGEIAAGGDAVLTLSVAVGELAAGTYRDTLTITTSDPLLPVVRIQVTLVVGSGGGGSADVTPNPFNPATASTVALTLPKAATSGTTANIYDLGGRLVKEFDAVSAGTTTLSWDGKTNDEHTVASGVYFCYVEAPGANGFKHTFKIAVKKN